MNEKDFVDCDGRIGEIKVRSDLIRISKSTYSGDIWVERCIDSKKINTVHVEMFNYHISPNLFEILYKISRRNDSNYSPFYQYRNGDPILLPGLVVGSNSQTEKIFWEDLKKALHMVSNID